MEISLHARPKLARKAVLRRDRRSGADVILYPERGLELNAVGAAIARRCDGAHTVAEIVAALEGELSGAPPGEIERDVVAFLARLAERGLLTGLA